MISASKRMLADSGQGTDVATQTYVANAEPGGSGWQDLVAKMMKHNCFYMKNYILMKSNEFRICFVAKARFPVGVWREFKNVGVYTTRAKLINFQRPLERAGSGYGKLAFLICENCIEQALFWGWHYVQNNGPTVAPKKKQIKGSQKE